MPVTVGFRRQAHYDGTRENFAGDLGVGSDPGLIGKLKEADLILAIGSRLGDAVTQGYTLLDKAGACRSSRFCPTAPKSAGCSARPLGIVSDLNMFRHCRGRAGSGQTRLDEWTQELRSLREAQRAVPNYQGPLNLGTVMRELEALLTPDAIVTTDAGNFAGWATRFLNFSEGQRYIGPTNGAMGYSVPAAVGAKIAFPDRMVVSMVGDGGFMMTGQEIATAFHHGVAPIVLVFNNQMYGTIRMHQERAYPWRVSGTALTNPDFCKYIEAFRRPRRNRHCNGRILPGVQTRRRVRQARPDRTAHQPRTDQHARHHRRPPRRPQTTQGSAQTQTRTAPIASPRPKSAVEPTVAASGAALRRPRLPGSRGRLSCHRPRHPEPFRRPPSPRRPADPTGPSRRRAALSPPRPGGTAGSSAASGQSRQRAARHQTHTRMRSRHPRPPTPRRSTTSASPIAAFSSTNKPPRPSAAPPPSASTTPRPGSISPPHWRNATGWRTPCRRPSPPSASPRSTPLSPASPRSPTRSAAS